MPPHGSQCVATAATCYSTLDSATDPESTNRYNDKKLNIKNSDLCYEYRTIEQNMIIPNDELQASSASDSNNAVMHINPKLPLPTIIGVKSYKMETGDAYDEDSFTAPNENLPNLQSFQTESTINDLISGSRQKPKSSWDCSLLIPCMAVFSSNYNFTVTSIALYIMKENIEYQETLQNVMGNGTIKMLSYAGAIGGMCAMGYLGDILGRRLAMIFTLFLVILGALGSSVLCWGNALSIAIIMGVSRFILGIGSGGVYPLSAVTAAEGSSTEKSEDRSMRVSWAYSMNVPGILFPYLLALFMWYISNENVELSFRVLLGFGAIPAFVVWLPAWRMADDRRFINRDFGAQFIKVFGNKQYYSQLLGTGVCWFLYDVTAYGILLAQPDITNVIFGGATTVKELIVQNIILNAIGFPGCFMGILVLRQMGIKWLQFWGFACLGLSACLMALVALVAPSNTVLQMVILCLVNFFINWGASICTFILPSVVYPPDVRSTYSGISAAMGKVGAVIGIYLMAIILKSCGLPLMMLCAGIPSLIAAVLTWIYVTPIYSDFKYSLKMCFSSLGASIPFVDFRRTPPA